MKKIILLLWYIVPLTAFAQHQFVIIGKVKNIQAPAKIYLYYHRAGERSHLDSTTVKNDEFDFQGMIADTVLADIYVDYKGVNLEDIWGKNGVDSKRIYLVSGITYLIGNDSACNAELSGTKINIDYWKYTTLIKKAPSDSVRAILDKQFIKENPDSYISLDQAMNNLDKMGINVDEMEPIFYSLTADVRSGKEAILFKNYLNSLKASVVGSMAPEFSMPDSSGILISLVSFKGKYVLIDFWASWCGPCRKENPNLVKQFEKYKTSNFTILGVSLDRPGGKDLWLKAIKSDGLTWCQVTELNGFDNKAALLYGIKSIPQNFLIDPSGKIIAKNLFGDDLDKKLAEVLGK